MPKPAEPKASKARPRPPANKSGDSDAAGEIMVAGAEMMRGAGFGNAVRLDWLRLIIEDGRDKLLQKVPTEVADGIEQLRDISAHFDFRDDFLRAGPIGVRTRDNADPTDMSIAACRYAVAYGEPNESRLPLIALRAYARACTYAEALRLDSEAPAHFAKMLETAFTAFGGDPHAQWGQFLTRGGAWKGTPLSKMFDYLRSSEESRGITGKLDDGIRAVDESLKYLQEIMLRFQQRSQRPGGRNRNIVKNFLVFRLAEIFVILTGRKPPMSADYTKDRVWPDFVNACAKVSGVAGSARYGILRDARKVDRERLDFMVRQVEIANERRNSLEGLEAIEELCRLDSAEELWRAGVDPEPTS